MNKKQLEVNIIAIETHLNSLLAEKEGLEEDIELANNVIRGYSKTISNAIGDDKKKHQKKLEDFILDKEYLKDKLDIIEKNIKNTTERYYNAITEYTGNGGIKRKVVKRKVISVQSAKASKPVKPTTRKPTKTTTRKPTKPTKPTTRKPTIVRRK